MTKDLSQKPTFFIAGAAKCGSFTLYHYLDKHPDIFMSSTKEPAYFAQNYSKGIEWYNSFFADYNGEKAVGEATVEYMVNKNSAKRIKNDLPNAKFIFILRNPYERANSHYWHRIKKRNISKDLSFKKLISSGKDSFPIKYGLYYTHLKRFLNVFPKEQIKILMLEDLKSDRERVFKEIFKFLEVDPNVKIDYKGDKNTAKIQKSFILEDTLNYFREKFNFLKRYPSLKKKLVNIYKIILDKNKKEFEKPKLSSEELSILYKYFKSEIEGLEKILDRKLPGYKEYDNKNIEKYINK